MEVRLSHLKAIMRHKRVKGRQPTDWKGYQIFRTIQNIRKCIVFQKATHFRLQNIHFNEQFRRIERFYNDFLICSRIYFTKSTFYRAPYKAREISEEGKFSPLKIFNNLHKRQERFSENCKKSMKFYNLFKILIEILQFFQSFQILSKFSRKYRQKFRRL